jgi:tetratricopeptide (TPR) repeat protein
LDSSDYHGHRNRGQVLCLQKKYEKAIPDLSFAINAVPTDSRSYGFRSEAYAALKQYGHAISDLIALAKLDPAQRKEACNIIMSLCAMKEKYDVAVTAFTKIIAAVPDCVSAYQNRGVCYRRLGKGELADADIAKAKILEATPKSNASPNTTPELHD